MDILLTYEECEKLTKNELIEKLIDSEHTFDLALDCLRLDDCGFKFYYIMENLLTEEGDNNRTAVDRMFLVKQYKHIWEESQKDYKAEVQKTHDLIEGILKEKKPLEEYKDKEVIDLICNYIEDRYTYQVTNSPMMDFVETKKGQCYHIATAFKDLCKSFGYNCQKVYGQSQGGWHVWNRIILDNKEYYFDLTFNITATEADGDVNYRWMTASEMSLEHMQVDILDE